VGVICIYWEWVKVWVLGCGCLCRDNSMGGCNMNLLRVGNCVGRHDEDLC
jgi:hypothetical protein